MNKHFKKSQIDKNHKMTNNSLSKIPCWDSKAESFCVYISKFEAYAEFMDIRDVFDPVLMVNCPTGSEFS